MTSIPTAPSESFETTPNEPSLVEDPEPVCECGSERVNKHGTYGRHPHGRAPVRVQRYWCLICGGTFSPSLSFIEDDYWYPDEVRRLVRVVNAFTDASLERLQDICTGHFCVRPSDQQVHNWIAEDTGEIVENDLPMYSGIYTYDEQFLWIDGKREYRLILYDDLMGAPVAEQAVDRCSKSTVREFLTTALEDKPVFVVTTDGRSDYAEIVEDDLGAFHHRCHFHFLKNGEKKLRNKVFQSVRYSNAEKLHAAIVWSEFKSVFAAPSYAAALRRFEAVLDKIEHLPPAVRTYVKEVMENFDKFAVHLRDEWVPSTTNNAERYFSHTKPTQVKRRFRSRERVHSFLKTQMIVRTVKHGFISQEASLARMRELFPDIEMEAVTPLFTETKKRYLWSRDLEAG
ncbi:transposase [Halococcus sp. AFM35]|uniref:transposase n=1 Tax=Halococcus sp. AFM35 TaxID=3421653 RepID=UPI003EB6ED4A